MKNNKGFSLVELIIVIAIMAILAGALAPALIKYINKSRRSTDISNADTIRSALQTAMSDEDAADALGTGFTTATAISDIKTNYGQFSSEFSDIVGTTSLKTKYQNKGCEFKAIVDVTNNVVTVYSAGGVEISPDSTSY
ncbi:MAG: type II secretion system protein [Coprococcus sp.]